MKKIISCILLCLVVLCSFPLLAFAKTEEIVVPVGEGSTSRVFQITWPNTDQEASVTITSPDGTVYSTEQTPEAHCGEGLIVFNVGAAAPGNWVVSITGEGLGTVSVDSGELPGSMEIESFAVEMRGGKAYASWKILDCPESMQLQVYAGTDTDGYDGQEVSSFTAGAEGEQEISLSGLDGGRYHFYLYVRGEQGIFTRKYAEESLLWFEDSASQELSGVKARMLDGDIFLTWGEVNEDSSYRVMVFAPDNGGLLHDEIVEADTSFLWTLPEQYDGAQAAVALWENGRTGRFTEYPLQRSAQPEAYLSGKGCGQYQNRPGAGGIYRRVYRVRRAQRRASGRGGQVRSIPCGHEGGRQYPGVLSGRPGGQPVFLCQVFAGGHRTAPAFHSAGFGWAKHPG